MDIEICIKYLDFVSNECNKHLKDGNVTDDELINLIIEIQRFKEKCLDSELPQEIKSKLSEVNIHYTIKKVERSTWFLFAAFVTFGSWAILMYWRQQAKRKQVLNDIKFDTSRLSSSLRINY